MNEIGVLYIQIYIYTNIERERVKKIFNKY